MYDKRIKGLRGENVERWREYRISVGVKFSVCELSSDLVLPPQQFPQLPDTDSERRFNASTLLFAGPFPLTSPNSSLHAVDFYFSHSRIFF